jgi:hypothetical protein
MFTNKGPLTIFIHYFFYKESWVHTTRLFLSFNKAKTFTSKYICEITPFIQLLSTSIVGDLQSSGHAGDLAGGRGGIKRRGWIKCFGEMLWNACRGIPQWRRARELRQAMTYSEGHQYGRWLACCFQAYWQVPIFFQNKMYFRKTLAIERGTNALYRCRINIQG